MFKLKVLAVLAITLVAVGLIASPVFATGCGVQAVSHCGAVVAPVYAQAVYAQPVVVAPVVAAVVNPYVPVVNVQKFAVQQYAVQQYVAPVRVQAFNAYSQAVVVQKQVVAPVRQKTVVRQRTGILSRLRGNSVRSTIIVR